MNYQFSLVFTIDPVPTARPFEPSLEKGFNAIQYAQQWLNYYQQSDTRSLPGGIARGREISGASNILVTENEFIMNNLNPKHGHAAITDYQTLLDDLSLSVSNVAASVMDY
ncbi:hypothetical protein [Tuwongella immobilis]|uniref:hypothetical protein n=1 Tax=Tuwongella immobilis TaxID=692036 RepID=UPI001E49F5D9|nr:hypothetical protein [Tuwongella immobilis]